jgi:hypothetical protein
MVFSKISTLHTYMRLLSPHRQRIKVTSGAGHVGLFKHPRGLIKSVPAACDVRESNKRDQKVMSLARAAERDFKDADEDWDVCCLLAVFIES